MRVYTCMCGCLPVYLHACVYVCVCVCVCRLCLHACADVSTYARACAYVAIVNEKERERETKYLTCLYMCMHVKVPVRGRCHALFTISLRMPHLITPDNIW